MSLIDLSFFQGEINIPNPAKQAEHLTALIEKREKELLTGLLGYGMYKAFITGLQQPIVEQRWTDLLQGVDYTKDGVLKSWRGLVSVGGTGVTVVDNLNTYMIQVGRGQTVVGGYTADDPITGSNQVAIPPAVIGRPFTFWHKLLGQLDPDEYQVIGGLVRLLPYPATVFQVNDRYYFKASALLPNQSTGIRKESLIANYVYYWYARDKATQTTGIGETVTRTDNSVRNNPAQKQARAWNEMVIWNCDLYIYLEDNRELYADYDCWGHDRNLFKSINPYNL